MVRYSENPTARVEVQVAAPPSALWPLVSDITVPVRFSTELVAADWADGTYRAVTSPKTVRAKSSIAEGSPLSPSVSAGSGFFGSTRMIARSRSGSMPMISTTGSSL